MKQRLESIDIMQGLAMFLVVLGHQSVSFAAAWYAPLHACIYSFHMGLILSFFLFATALAIKAAVVEIPYIITGVLSIPTCFGLSRLIRNQTVVKGVLESLSRHSFIIYLLQMFVVNACAICWNMLNLQKALPFSVFLLLSTCAAIIIPIYISVVYDKLQTKLKIVSR